ncbi:MAG: asparagine synthase C-terminal domain-containing protein [Ignavibacteriaceae bacterium]
MQKNGCYFFGSEVKAFKYISKFELNEKQLYEQFRYAYVSGQNTIFKNIYRVKPGTYMKFNREGFVTENQYYSVIDTLNEQPNQDLNLEEIKQDIDESIFKHTMSDVGYNVQLSGGIDSGYITTVLSKKYKQTLHTYSGELELQERNESKYQKIVAERCNTFHHNYLFKSKDLFDNYEKATWHLDIPMVGQASTFLMLLCQQSRNNSKVILTGEGSDELFGGYDSFRRIKINKFMALDFLQRHDLIIKLIPNALKFRKIKNSIKNIHLGIDQSAYFSKEKFRSVFNIHDENIEYRKSVVRDFDQLVNKILASFQTSHLNALFERQDKMSMAMSVEARVPFSNHKLFEKINQIPFKKKIKPIPKTILKKLTNEYYGKSFVYRKKNGFELPLNDWLRDEKGLKPWFSLLTDKTFYERGFYNHKSINSLINKHLNKAEDNSICLMNIINFEIWHRIFID